MAGGGRTRTTWTPEQARKANPSGLSKEIAARYQRLRHKFAKAAEEGADEVIEFALGSEAYVDKERMQAYTFLVDRAFGKAAQTIEMQVTDEVGSKDVFNASKDIRNDMFRKAYERVSKDKQVIRYLEATGQLEKIRLDAAVWDAKEMNQIALEDSGEKGTVIEGERV